ncbi:MAG: GGDEF domain-containing protein, partial [Solirubrobacteraceae bacterium]
EGRNRVCAAKEGETGSAWGAAGEDVGAAGEDGGTAARRSARASDVAQVVAPPSSRPAQSSLADPAATPGPVTGEEAPRGGSWLVRDDAARAHMLDVAHGIEQVRLFTYGVVFVALVLSIPAYGWGPALPPIVGGVVMGVVLANLGRWRRPEIAILAAVLLSLAANAAGYLAISRSDPFPALSILIISAFAWTPVFPARGVAIIAVSDAILIVLAAFASGSGAALANPLILGVPLTLLLAAAFMGAALGRSSIEHRGAAVIDALTGMLNRQALETRVAAVGHEVDYSHESVALMVCDIDHFKQINDRAGHALGDAVLREVAYRMRKSLRAFEAAYRIGGEEFLVLLKGATMAQASDIAERIRASIAAEPIEGLPVTMSIGVAGSDPQEGFDYAAVFARADACLYEAKRGGRDRVRTAPDGRADPASPPSVTSPMPTAS